MTLSDKEKTPQALTKCKSPARDVRSPPNIVVNFMDLRYSATKLQTL
jgi:hypothetical protein